MSYNEQRSKDSHWYFEAMKCIEDKNVKQMHYDEEFKLLLVIDDEEAIIEKLQEKFDVEKTEEGIKVKGWLR